MGLPVASALEERLGRSLAAAAVVWMLAVAAWGINGHFGDGHFASTAAAAVAGDNMWRYRILYPVLSYADSLGSANSYLHHPLGVFWVAALAEKVFGPHDWAARLPAVVYSTLTPLFVYRFGRAAWGPIEGALAAWAYVSLPITIATAGNIIWIQTCRAVSIVDTGIALPPERTLYMTSSSFSLLVCINSAPNATSDSNAAPTIRPT